MAKHKTLNSNKLYKEECEINIWEGDSEGPVSNAQLYQQAHNIGDFNINDFNMFLDITRGADKFDTEILSPKVHEYLKSTAREKLYENLVKNGELPKLDVFNDYGVQIKPLSPEAGTRLIEQHPKAILLLEDPHRTSEVNQKIAIKSMMDYLHTFENSVKDDKQIAMLAVQHDPRLLEYVSDRLKDDKYVVYEAVKEYSDVIVCASENMQNIAGKNDPAAGLERAINAEKLHGKLNKACAPKVSHKPTMKI
jgi:hypothetical protein